MLIEVIHINGQYSPDSGSYTPPKGMALNYYKELSLILQQAIKKGASIIYHPNLMTVTNSEEIALAIQSDPFLTEFPNRDALVIRPDFPAKNLEQVKSEIEEEDKLLKQHGTAVVLGAYSKWCVPAVAHNLMSRNPGYRIGIDLSLSIDNGGHYVRAEHARVPGLSLTKMLGGSSYSDALRL